MSDEPEDKPVVEEAKPVDKKPVDKKPAPGPKKPDVWDQTGEWLIANGALPAVGVITIAVFIIHFGVFRGESAGDDLSFHFAESARIADCLRVGDFDLWNPSANGGYASAYYYQVIPQLASALPAAIFGHHLFWFQLSIVLPLVLAPAAAYRGLRLLGATPWQSAVGAFCVAFTNGASRWGGGNAGTFQVGLYTQTWALAAFPLALGYAARWMSEARGLAPAVAWGAFVFLCHPFIGVTLALTIFMGWLAFDLWLGGAFLLRLIAGRYGGGLIFKRVREYRPDANWREMLWQLLRGAILGALLLLTWSPIWLPLVFDGSGFGGFPHRVGDEVGPGFIVLRKWMFAADGWMPTHWRGEILDFMPPNFGVRLPLLTLAVPFCILFARGRMFRWIWPAAVVFFLMLGAGPHMGKIGDDVFPPVRALGTMQCLLAMGVGAGAVAIGQWLWNYAGKWPHAAYSVRTGLAALAAALIVLVALPGSRALAARVRVLGDYKNSHRTDMIIIGDQLAKLPPGRKQVGPGAENHWWNLLSYAYDRVPSLLQMGGGGLQASPNYDFLWTYRDYVKNAWIYDAPYLVFDKSRGQKMPVGDTVGGTDAYEIRRLPSPGLVSPVQVTGTLPPGYRNTEPGHKAALEWEKTEAPMKDQVMAYAGSGGAGPEPKGKTLRSWRQDSPGSEADIVAEVQADAPTTFVIRESWHPRWHAYVDGNEVPVRRVTPDFPAVDVPTGKHTIELRFERPWWLLASWLLWPGLSIGAWYVLRRLARRNAPPLPPEARALPKAA
ncbi:MAG: hypothetical protein JO257_27855 [Deltaproteobacteria bacterium]|nr:hypothetical protein [Deltaproteobacteria bacterium]